MRFNHHRRFHFAHNVPTVFTDDLSYLEMIGKVFGILKELPDGITEYIDGIFDDMGIDPSTMYKHLYDARAYGAVGDGKTDNTEALQTMLTECHDAGGGICFLPVGKYIIGKCLCVGKNTIFVGESTTRTEIYLNDETPFWGTAVGVFGSNTAVGNMTINYLDKGKSPSTMGSMWGAIGMTTADFHSAINGERGAEQPNIENVTLFNLATAGLYLAQVEPVTYARNIHFNGLTGENAMVSAYGHYQTHGAYHNYQVENVTIENCNCSVIRVVGQASCRNVTVRNCYANFGLIDAVNTSIYDCIFSIKNGMSEEWANVYVDRLLSVFGDDTEKGNAFVNSINNVILEGATGDTRSAFFVGRSGNWNVTGLQCVGFNDRRTITGNANAKVVYTNCILGNSNSATGEFFCCDNVNYALSNTVFDNTHSGRIQLTLQNGYYTITNLMPGLFYKTGHRVTGVAYYGKTDESPVNHLVLGETIAKLPGCAYPTENRVIHATIRNRSAYVESPAIVEIKTDGDIILYYAYGKGDLSGYDSIIFELDFYID